MSNKMRARNRQPFDFQDGLRINGLDINAYLQQNIQNGNILFSLVNATNDSDAATKGIKLNQLYRSDSVVKVRIS